MASVILLFPLPLGPTTDVTPGTKSTDTRSAKDLNPAISNLFKTRKAFLLFSVAINVVYTKQTIIRISFPYIYKRKESFILCTRNPLIQRGFLIVVLLTFSTLLQQLVALLLFRLATTKT